MSDKQNRLVKQIITVLCAICGEPTKVSNKETETPFNFGAKELWFSCPHCNSVYDVPVELDE